MPAYDVLIVRREDNSYRLSVTEDQHDTEPLSIQDEHKRYKQHLCRKSYLPSNLPLNLAPNLTRRQGSPFVRNRREQGAVRRLNAV